MNLSIMLIRFFFFATVLIFFTSCNSSKDSAQETKFTPVSSVPIYKSYEKMKHIFEYNNDTTYIINFWATWCKPCVAELPYFAELHTKYKKDKVRIILVSLDFEKKIESHLIPFINERKLQSEVMVLLDPKTNQWIDKVDPKWSGAIPITIVYNKEKRKFIEESFDSFDDLNNIVQPFLN